MTSQITRSVCVFCGSRPGANPAFMAAGQALGTALAHAGIRLVYGAGDVGIMGAVARSAQSAGGETFGVIPVHLMQREVGKTDLTRFVITQTMHERKKVMFMNSDVIVTLPGGPGSLDEFFEVLTWRQLGLHGKPLYLLNIGGYWDRLVGLIDHVVAEGFADPGFADNFTVADSVDHLMECVRADLS